jgi:hypothetical protein
VERVIEQREPVRFSPYRIPVRPLIVGLVATAGMLTFYLGLVSLISWSWDHALSLLVEDRWFVTLLVVGFGVQAGLFTYLRALHGAGKAPAAVTGSSVGVSTAAMVACCAHHLTDVLPLLGLSAATVFLAEYKVPFLVVGLVSNAAGIGLLSIRIRQARRCHPAAESSTDPTYHAPSAA